MSPPWFYYFWFCRPWMRAQHLEIKFGTSKVLEQKPEQPRNFAILQQYVADIVRFVCKKPNTYISIQIKLSIRHKTTVKDFPKKTIGPVK